MVSPGGIRPRFWALALAFSGLGSRFQENRGTLGSWLDKFPYLCAKTGFAGEQEIYLEFVVLPAE